MVSPRAEAGEFSHGAGSLRPWLLPKVSVERARATSPSCVHCQAALDDAEHTIFLCPFVDDNRAELARALNRSPCPEDVMDLLCDTKWEELPSDPAQWQRILASCSRRSELFKGMVGQ